MNFPGLRTLNDRMNRFEQELAAALAELKGRSLLRHLRNVDSAQGARVRIGGRSMLMLCSNNYLGLAGHPRLRDAARHALERYGVGAGASRLIAGSLDPLSRLERRLARFQGTEAALVFGSGYLANLGTITALAGKGDVVLGDELNHASLIDGCRLSRAEVRVFRHRDCGHLQVLLEQSGQARRRLIVTDAVFSMDGDCARLAEMVELKHRFDAVLMVDEAHAIGVLGPGGAGLAAHIGLGQEVDVRIGTLSKALGSYGAYAAGSHILAEFLINRARSFIYTTGLAPALAAAAEQALAILEEEPERRRLLLDNAEYLRDKLGRAGFRIAPTQTPIIPVMLGDERLALAMAAALFERGVYVTAIRPPTVPPGSARLRVTPTAEHTQADLDDVLTAFVESGRELELTR